MPEAPIISANLLTLPVPLHPADSDTSAFQGMAQLESIEHFLDALILNSATI